MSEKKPCFEDAFEKLSDVIECLEGTPEAEDCNHLCKGGTWETCKSGGQSRYLQQYKDVVTLKSLTPNKPCLDAEGEWPQAELSLRAMTEADYLALVREVKNLARIVRRMSIEALNPNLIFEELSEVIDALAKLEDEAK